MRTDDQVMASIDAGVSDVVSILQPMEDSAVSILNVLDEIKGLLEEIKEKL